MKKNNLLICDKAKTCKQKGCKGKTPHEESFECWNNTTCSGKCIPVEQTLKITLYENGEAKGSYLLNDFSINVKHDLKKAYNCFSDLMDIFETGKIYLKIKGNGVVVKKEKKHGC